MTLFELYSEGERMLAQAGVENPQIDARELLLSAFGLDLTHYLLDRLKSLPENEECRALALSYREMAARRAEHVPLQQILQSAEFMGLPFYVNEHVLIPRQDTETLVELVLERLCAGRGRKSHMYEEFCAEGLRLLDLCTGSGCIAVSLAVKGGFGQVDAADLSAEALEVAEKNARALCAGMTKFRFLLGNLFEAVPQGTGAYDVITANPPYIPADVIEELSPEVRDHEPRLALDGGADGLKFYRRIAAEAGTYLVPDGWLFLEIGYDQGLAVRELLEAAGFVNIEVRRDLAGNDRVAFAQKAGGS